MPTPGAWSGPFVANAAGTQANKLAFDLVCDRGLFGVDTSNGQLTQKTVRFEVAVQSIDDDGAALGDWITFADGSITAATTTPQRRSIYYDVPAGRYQARVRRMDIEDTGSNVGHSLYWAGLRAYLVAANSFGDRTLLAIRAVASGGLQGQATRQIRVICTRKLPTWNPDTGWSAAIDAYASHTATRSVAWAAANVLRARYGGRQPDSRLDLQALYELDQVWSARGDTFNFIFDTTAGLWDSLTKILRAGRAKPYQQGGVVRFVRHSPQTLPVQMFTPRNMVKGSFGVDYLFPTEDTADAVRVTYWDEKVWTQRTVKCVLPGEEAKLTDPDTVWAEKSYDGVTSREQAKREGTYDAAMNRYARRMIRFDTEMEGFIPSHLDLIAVAHDVPGWGQHSEVAAWDAETLTITSAEPFTWDDSAHLCRLRRPNGSSTGAISVTRGADDSSLVLASAPDFDMSIDFSSERTFIVFGPSQQEVLLARMLTAAPRSDTQVSIEVFNEDPRIHLADQGQTIDVPPVSQLLKADLTIKELHVVTRPVTDGSSSDAAAQAIQLDMSWRAPGRAEIYEIQRSDDQRNWTRVAEISVPHFTLVLATTQAYLQIRARTAFEQGPWLHYTFTSNVTPAAPDAPASIALRYPFTGDTLAFAFSAVANATGYRAEVWFGAALRRTFITTGLAGDYSFSQAVADGGPNRNIEIRVYAQNAAGDESTTCATLDATNPQITAIPNPAYAGTATQTAGSNYALSVDFVAGVLAADAALLSWELRRADTLAAVSSGNVAVTASTSSVSLGSQTLDSSLSYEIRAAITDKWGADGIAWSSWEAITLAPLASTGTPAPIAATVTCNPTEDDQDAYTGSSAANLASVIHALVANGVGPFTYSWAPISGSSGITVYAGGATANVTLRSGVARGISAIYSTVFRVTVTDTGNGGVTCTADVPIRHVYSRLAT